MWVVILSNGDADYTSAYGPFDDVSEANELLPKDKGMDQWRVIELGSVEDLEEEKIAQEG